MVTGPFNVATKLSNLPTNGLDGVTADSTVTGGATDVTFGAGAVTGYTSAAVLPMAFPEVCYSYLCAIAIPQVNANGANAVALHLRIPVN